MIASLALENPYQALRADFETAYQKMIDSSREFNAVLMNLSSALSQEERRSRTDHAAQAYEDAYQCFLTSVRRLDEFRIAQIISSHAAIQPAAARATGSSSALRR